MLPLPSPWRSTELHPDRCSGEHDCNGRTRGGSLPHDRTTPISSHPWPRASICPSVSANGGDPTFDAGAGWGNIMDDLYAPTVTTTFGYAAADVAPSATTAGRSAGSGSVGTPPTHGRQQHHHPSADNGSIPPPTTTTSTVDPAEEERAPPWGGDHPASSAAGPIGDRAVDGYTSRGKRRRSDSDVNMDAGGGAIIAGGGAGRESPSCLNSSNSNAAAFGKQQHAWAAAAAVSSGCSLSSSDGPPPLLPNVSALYGGSNGSRGGSLPAAVGVVGGGAGGDRGGVGAHHPADTAWQALGAAAASRAALEAAGHVSTGLTAAGHNRLFRGPGPADHHYTDQQLPMMTTHPRFVAGHPPMTNMRDGRGGGGGVDFGKFVAGIVSPSCHSAEPPARVPCRLRSTSGTPGPPLLSDEGRAASENGKVADGGSAAAGRGPGVAGDGGWRPQAGRAEEHRCDFVC